jgi:hypothetical protein
MRLMEVNKLGICLVKSVYVYTSEVDKLRYYAEIVNQV